MNSKTLAVLVASAILLVLLVGAYAWRTWRVGALPAVPVGKTELTIDPDAPCVEKVLRIFPPPSTSLADLLREADAVLVVQLLMDATERHVTEGKGSSPYTHTIYSFTVRESVKGPMRPGDTVRIARMGGRQCFEEDFPRPGLGEQFVVFLEWWPDAGAYRHHYGPLTTFLIANHEIQPIGPLFRNHLGRREDEFVRELKATAARPQVR